MALLFSDMMIVIPAPFPTAIREVVSGGALPNGDYGLTERENEILKLMVAGHPKRKIADLLFISYYTVDTHIKNIYAKLHVHTRSCAITKVLREHLV